ncbi:MAG: FtsX-like permease family protein, partial [Gemmatimonadaceae bacterium]
MERIAHDFRIAWRGFRRTPGFPIAVLIVLSISIGSAVAMFTTTRAVVLQQMPVLQPEQLAVLTSYQIPSIEVSPPATVIRQMRHRLNSVTDIAGVGHWGTAQSPFVEGEQTRILNLSDVTANYFSVLGARAFLGRLFVDADEDFGAAPPMVLSYRAWQSRYGGDSSVVGRQLMWPYTRVVYTIVGVAPPGLDYPLGVECWTPMAANDSRQTLAVVRLKRGVSLNTAQMEYFREANRLHPVYHLKGASGKPFMDVVVGDARPALSLLSAAVALLLLIACVNIANMFLLRAGQRARELALRRVLGASYWSIVRQLLTESMMLAVTGGVLGTAVAVALIRAVVWFAPQQLPRLDLLRIDVSIFVIAIGVTVFCVVCFGVAPALIAANASKEKSARASARAGSQTRSRTRLRDGLVASQVALSLTLLVAAGLVSRSLMSLQNESLGYEATHLSIASVAWDVTKSGTPEKILAMGRELERRLREFPEIQSTSPMLLPPFYGVSVWHGAVQGEADAPNAMRPVMDVPIEIGGSGYFETMGIPITQ